MPRLAWRGMYQLILAALAPFVVTALVLFGPRAALQAGIFFLVAATCLGLPLGIVVLNANRPILTLTDHGIEVKSWSSMTRRKRVVPFSQGRWHVDRRGRLVLRLFGLSGPMFPTWTYLPRMTVELPEEQRAKWVSRLRDAGAPEQP